MSGIPEYFLNKERNWSVTATWLNVILNPKIREHFSTDREQELCYICVIVYPEVSVIPLCSVSDEPLFRSDMHMDWLPSWQDTVHVPSWQDTDQSFHIKNVS